jgi:hypothetical protein
MQDSTCPWFVGVSFAILLGSLPASSAFAARPTLSVSVSPTVITNEGEQAIITITASTPPARNLRVNFFLTGNAFLNLDYLLIAPAQTPQIVENFQLLFPAGQSSIQVILRSMAGEDRFALLVANFFLRSGARYRLGHPRGAFVTIRLPNPTFP